MDMLPKKQPILSIAEYAWKAIKKEATDLIVKLKLQVTIFLPTFLHISFGT